MATGKLAEVEEDAVYIQSRRFQEQREEAARAQEKADRQQAKNKTGKDNK